eukprot:m.104510 g.104510  ORF g.104510 m.104510 type:complete len:821 (+) comp15250_c0_seq1:166-2628(+)
MSFEPESGSEPPTPNLDHLDLAEASPKHPEHPIQPSLATLAPVNALEWDDYGNGRCDEDTIVEEATYRPSSQTSTRPSDLSNAYPATSTMSLPGDVGSMEHNHYRSLSAGNAGEPSSHRGAAPAPWTIPRNKDGKAVSVTAEQMRRHKSTNQDGNDASAKAQTGHDGDAEHTDCFDSPWAPSVLILLAILICLLLPGALFRVYSPDTQLGDVSIAGWGAIIAILIGIQPLVQLLYRVVGAVVILVARLRKRSPAKVGYYVDGMQSAVVTLVWLLVVTITFHELLGADLFPPGRAPGETTNAPSRLWWVTRLFICFIVMALFGVMRAYLTRSVALKRRAAGYHQRVRDAVMAAKVLAILTRPIPARMIAPRAKQAPAKPRKPRRSADHANDGRKQFRMWKAKAQGGPASSRLRKAETDTQSNYSGRKMEDNHGFLGNPASFLKGNTPATAVDIDHLLADANVIQKDPIAVCKRGRNLRTVKDARYLGSALFDWYQGRQEDAAYTVTVSPQETLAVDRLLKPLLEGSKLQKHAQTLFDPGSLGSLTRDQLMAGCTEIFLGRKNLSTSLRDLDSIIAAIDTFLYNVQFVVLFLAVLVVFSTGELADVAVTSGTTILALSFIFADTCQHTFKSFMLLFVRHPFDSGDRVEIEGMNKPLYVQKMTLQYTVFTVWNGMVVTIPNYELYAKSIYNVQRSGMMWDEASIHISSRTTAEQLDRLEQGYKQILRSHPFDFDEPNSFFFLKSLDDSNKLTLSLVYAMRTNWQNGEHVERRSMLTRGLFELCGRLNVSLSQVTQPVQLLNPPANSPNMPTGSERFMYSAEHP